MEGTWSGTVSGADGESGSLILDIEQEGEDVTGGSGELREDGASGGQAALLSVEGGSVEEDGSVTILAVQSGSDLPIRITGEVSGDALRATFAAAGDEFPITLGRDGGTGSSEDNLPDAFGGWAGTVADETGDKGRLKFSLEQKGRALSGSGVLVVGGERVPFRPLTGSVDDAGAVDLVREPESEGGSMNFSGTLEADSFSGEAALVTPDGSDRPEAKRGAFTLDRVPLP